MEKEEAMGNPWVCIIIGLFGGFASGMVGIGGGIIIVPALVFFLKFSEHLAQGTTLALMLPPIGLLAVWAYYRQGYVDFRVAGLICIGFLLGSWIGARLAIGISNEVLEKIFGVTMLVISLRMIFPH